MEGHSIKNSDYIEDDLRRCISVVNADVSPDLRQARITVSIMGRPKETNDATMEKRRAYSWLVRNTKMIRHALAQRLSHMKSVPNLSFVQADIGAAVDVMQLIEKVSQGYKRDDMDSFGRDSAMLSGMHMGMDFDEDYDDDDGWVDEDGDGFVFEEDEAT